MMAHDPRRLVSLAALYHGVARDGVAKNGVAKSPTPLRASAPAGLTAGGFAEAAACTAFR